MEKHGWIKIDRALLDHWIFQNADYLKAWIAILLLANHEDRTILVDRHPKLIRRGSFFTSVSKLSERLGFDRRKTVRLIEALKKDGMLSTDGTTHGTTLTIVNYDKYQGRGATDGTTDGTANGTADGTTDGTQTRMKKNNKEYKEARARAYERAKESGSDYGPVRRTSFENFEQRHTDYDALFDEIRERTGKAVI